MTDAVPDTLSAAPPPDRRIFATAALSVLVHLLLLGAVMLPRLSLPEPADPPAVNVDLVPPPQLSSQPSAPPAEASKEPPASEASSAATAEASSGEASSAAPSSAAASSEEAGSSEQPSTSEASAQESNTAARPIVIPVGPSEPPEEISSLQEVSSASAEAPSSAASEESSADVSSAASEEVSAPSALTAEGGGTEGAGTADAAPAGASETAPTIKGALHVARHFYLKAMLDAPAMARAREAIKTLPPDKRLVQTCNIEAVGQLGNAGRGFAPDAVIADALAAPVADGSTFTVTGGAFRSDGKWRALAYTCTLSKDLGSIKSFSYRIGDDVTATLKSRLGE